MHLDPNGMRPLSIGKMGDAYVVASETCAFDVVGAEFVRDVVPGELLIINDEGFTFRSVCTCVQPSNVHDGICLFCPSR